LIPNRLRIVEFCHTTVMAKIAYLECPTGLAGDMCLGALVHAGVPLDYLATQLKRLGIGDEFDLWADLVQRNGQQATKVHVDLLHRDRAGQVIRLEEKAETHSTFAAQQHQPESLPDHHPAEPHHHHGRHLPEIVEIIQASGLPERAIAWSLAVFQTLAKAEGSVHGIPPEQVHFHEVGATDALVDVVGTCLGFDWLNVDQIYCSAIPTGGGMVRAAHGLLPIPAPAVLKLLEMRQVPIYHNGINRELVTPTGAAIATTLATAFGAPPPMTLRKIGLGAGSIDLALPNIVRLWLGDTPDGQIAMPHKTAVQAHAHQHLHGHPPQPEAATEPMAVLQTQVDDLNPQAIGYLFERLFNEGAVDVFTQAIGMKKSRPGTLITVICVPAQVDNCQRVLFQETTTLGIRCSLEQRTILHREFHTVQTPLGAVQVKVARISPDGEIVNVQPEYEDCAAIARAHQKPWREIHQMVLLHWHQDQSHAKKFEKTVALGIAE
jgi:pyridinium-3,5-bisthiocarboxylic acid mononucleotide nickel chelatase